MFYNENIELEKLTEEESMGDLFELQEESIKINQASTSTGEDIIPPGNKVKSNLNEEEFIKINKIKIEIIRNKLIKSFLEKKININEKFDKDLPLPNLIKEFKTCEQNILVLQKRQISYYVKMGGIIKHIKTLFISNWKNILKENEINYTLDYLNFLIQLFNLFSKHKKLYKSTLTLSFFKKNFSIIKIIVKNGI